MWYKDLHYNFYVDARFDSLNEGNYLTVYRIYFISIFPIWIRKKTFNTGNAIWIHNSVFGYGNQHNIDMAFKTKKRFHPIELLMMLPAVVSIVNAIITKYL